MAKKLAVVDDRVMWLNLEAGTARSLRIRHGIHLDASDMSDGRRALVVEAAHTYFPEAGLEELPAIAAAEVAAGLTGLLRSRFATTDPDDPVLSLLRDELIADLGGSADCTGALTVVDRVYASRLVRHQVPPIITARCIAWYGHWRSCNAGPALETAQALAQCANAWTVGPEWRTELDAEILTHARALAGDPLDAWETKEC